MDNAKVQALVVRWNERVAAYERSIENSPAGAAIEIMQARQSELERCIMELQDSLY